MGETNTITIKPKGESTKGRIYAVRIKDIKNQGAGEYFSWDEGKWGANGTPKVEVGTGNIYVAFWATNEGLDGDLNLQLIDNSTGIAVQIVTGYAELGGGVGLEWTGDMPKDGINFTLKVTP